MNGRILGIGAVVLLAAAALVFLLTRPHQTLRPVPPPPVVATESQPTAQPVPADCLRPGPAPVPPDGNSASKEDMLHAHDVIQGFVVQLEAYQTCRNKQADAPGVPADKKEAFIEQGNSAIDDANTLAQLFSTQIAAYKAAHPGEK